MYTRSFVASLLRMTRLRRLRRRRGISGRAAFLVRYEIALLQRRQERLVLRSGVPQHPSVVAGVVDRFLLRLDLLRTIRRLTDRERLDPGTPVVTRRAARHLTAPARGNAGHLP